MTAEIVVMNKSGIALAADSKVTVGTHDGSKTFDTVDKIFMLSKVHPVGVMIFGNAEFMEYPWELVIKQFRSVKRSAHEPTVREWASSFMTYLASFGDISPENKADNLGTMLRSWFSEVNRQAMDDAEEADIALSSNEFSGVVHDVIVRLNARLRGRQDWVTGDALDALVTGYGDQITESITDYFGSFDHDDLLTAARSLAVLALAKHEYSPQSSGLVFAGFGDTELFPSVVHYKTDGYVGDAIKWFIFESESGSVSRDESSMIMAYAQKEMVQRFMEGIDPQYQRYVVALWGRAIEENCLNILATYGAPENQTVEVRAAISQALDESVKALLDSAKEERAKSYVMPIVEMVSLLPKDELPHLAESLIALTSLKRHVSSDAETVGGPVDVALISRGDGFIWIKRKHYFKAELNPQFARNYLRDLEN